MRIWFAFLILLLEIFHITTFAMDNSRSLVFNFTHDYLENSEKLAEAEQFFAVNKNNVVILVDDNAVVRLVVPRQLQKKNHAVFTVPNGDDLLEILRGKLIKSMLSNSLLIILDNQMPGTYGIDVMAAMNKEGLIKVENQERDAVPVVLNSDSMFVADSPELSLFIKVLPRKNSVDDIEEVLEKVSPRDDKEKT